MRNVYQYEISESIPVTKKEKTLTVGDKEENGKRSRGKYISGEK